jgi:hypothetical protein
MVSFSTRELDADVESGPVALVKGLSLVVGHPGQNRLVGLARKASLQLQNAAQECNSK